MESEQLWYLAGAAAFAVGSFVSTLVIISVLLVSLPATFFLDSHDRDLWIDRHPVIRWAGRVLKNGLGVLVLVMGFFLLLPGVPGQGLLTILIGVILLDVPGKRRIERWLLARRRVRGAVNRLRARFGRPPLVLEEDA